MFRNIVIGMSGGVDSAVAALLLREKGFNVLGVFMKNWDEFDEMGACSGEQDYRDAEYACHKLNVKLQVVNYVKDYWNSVFSNFLEDYQNGLTPNPDVLCNKYIKFDLFHKYAIETLEYDAVATGHYAKTTFGSYLEHYRADSDVQLLIPRDRFKDQTFFLSGVKRTSLCRTMFPLSDMTKSEVKELASKRGLSRLSHKKESTGICFVGNRDFKQFIKEYIHSRPGHFVDIDTNQVVGTHNGIHQWTIGQRCRLASFRQPYFVARKDVSTNTLYVASGHEHPILYSDYIHVNDINWLCADPLIEMKSTKPLRCRFRFQHTKPLVDCTVHKKSETPKELLVVLDKPLRAITPGQYAVFYSDTACLGSARIICSTKINGMPKQMEVLS